MAPTSHASGGPATLAPKTKNSILRANRRESTGTVRASLGRIPLNGWRRHDWTPQAIGVETREPQLDPKARFSRVAESRRREKSSSGPVRDSYGHRAPVADTGHDGRHACPRRTLGHECRTPPRRAGRAPVVVAGDRRWNAWLPSKPCAGSYMDAPLLTEDCKEF